MEGYNFWKILESEYHQKRLLNNLYMMFQECREGVLVHSYLYENSIMKIMKKQYWYITDSKTSGRLILIEKRINLVFS